MKIKKNKTEDQNIKRGFEPETNINSKYWSIIQVVRNAREEKDQVSGEVIRVADIETKLVEFFDNPSRNRFLDQLKEELGNEGYLNVLADNNTSWVMNKLFDDVEYLQKRVTREEVRRREER